MPQTPALPMETKTRNPLEIDIDENPDYEALMIRSNTVVANSNPNIYHDHHRAASYQDKSHSLMSNSKLSRLRRVKSSHYNLHPPQRPRRERINTVESDEECKSELAHSHVVHSHVLTINTMNRGTIVHDETREILSDDSMEDMYQEHTPTPIPDDTITPMTCNIDNSALAFDASVNCSVGMGVNRDRRYRHNKNASGSITSMTMTMNSGHNQQGQGRGRVHSLTPKSMRSATMDSMHNQRGRGLSLTPKSMEVKSWLENEVELPQYYDNFGNFGYESLRFIKEISKKEQLEDIGVVIKGHQTKLMAEIAKLGTTEDSQPEGVSGK